MADLVHATTYSKSLNCFGLWVFEAKSRIPPERPFFFVFFLVHFVFRSLIEERNTIGITKAVE